LNLQHLIQYSLDHPRIGMSCCSFPAFYQDADGVIAVSAFPIQKMVDTTGAGDLFAAGFLFGRVRGVGHENAGRLGGLAAAEVIQHIGARPQVSLKELANKHVLPV